MYICKFVANVQLYNLIYRQKYVIINFILVDPGSFTISSDFSPFFLFPFTFSYSLFSMFLFISLISISVLCIFLFVKIFLLLTYLIFINYPTNNFLHSFAIFSIHLSILFLDVIFPSLIFSVLISLSSST